MRATNLSGNGSENLTFIIAKGAQSPSGVASTLLFATGVVAGSLKSRVSYQTSEQAGGVFSVPEGFGSGWFAVAGFTDFSAASTDFSYAQ